MPRYAFQADRPIDKYSKSDVFFMVAVLLLWGLGMTTLFICTPNTAERLFHNKYYFVTRQLVWSFIGFAGLVFFALLPLATLRKLLPFIVIGSLVLCFIALIPGIGSERKGASRWIRLFNRVTIQPSEFAKLAVVLFLANLFDKQRESGQKEFYYPLLLASLLQYLLKEFHHK